LRITGRSGWILASACSLWLVAAVLAGSAVPAAASSTACIPSGTDASIQAALVGTGAQAVLCPSAVFQLSNTVEFTAPDQEIYTQGMPTDATRATLIIGSSSVGNAINAGSQPGAELESIQVNGNQPALGRSTSAAALIEMGGGGSDQVVDDIDAYNTRTWSTLHFDEGTVTDEVPECQDAQILDNQIGPAGLEPGTGPNYDSASGYSGPDFWADGISLDCGNTLVEGNTITDATDGGIVIFGAPGSTIEDNTIIASTQQLNGGINMVNAESYAGTTVTDNTIDGAGAFIHVGVAMGYEVWTFCPSTPVFLSGATVTDNTIEGENVGYGYAVNGVTDWTVSGNTDTARHVGVPGPGCKGAATTAPAAFQYEASGIGSNVSLQSQFVAAGNISGIAAGVEEPTILQAATSPTSCNEIAPGQGLYPGQQEVSCNGSFRLLLQTDGNLVLYEGGTPLWASNTRGDGSAEAIMQTDGNFVIYNASGASVWSTGTNGNGDAAMVVQNDGNLVMYSSSGTVLWASNTH
jgi:parallel beta-helix repeat protein